MTTRRRELILGAIVLAAIAIAGYLSTVAIDGGGPLSHPYLVRAWLPAGAPLLKDGDEVRIAGRRAGQVRSVAPGPRVTLGLDQAPVGRDARVAVRLRGLAGTVYVALDPGDTRRPLPSGGELPRSAARATTALTDVVEAFDADTRLAVQRALRGYGLGLAGRGADLNATLAELPDTAARLAPLARALTPEPGALAGLTGGLDRVARGLTGLGALVPPARRTLDALAPVDVDATLRALPGAEAAVAATLPGTDRLLDDARGAVRDLRPATAALRRALPALRGALRRPGALAELARVGRAATPALLAAAPALRELRPGARLLAPLAAPLGTLSTYLSRYRREILLGPEGFTQWGRFHYREGQAHGARAVRFSMVFTCHHARDPYPAPGAAEREEAPCG
jgi:phospholipid/cholesterol/gamma-HCH transport system substrate-binding protein